MIHYLFNFCSTKIIGPEIICLNTWFALLQPNQNVIFVTLLESYEASDVECPKTFVYMLYIVQLSERNADWISETKLHDCIPQQFSLYATVSITRFSLILIRRNWVSDDNQSERYQRRKILRTILRLLFFISLHKV